MAGYEAAGLVIFLALMAYAAYSDLTRYLIPNWISLAMIADFAVIAAVGVAVGAVDPMVLAWRIGAGALALLLGFLLFALRLFGGGDAKLLAASALWFSLPALSRYILLVALIGGVMAVIVLIARRFARRRAGGGQKWLNELLSGEHGIPYGVAIAAAAWAVITPLLAAPGL